MATFVLVHGAWSGSLIWRNVARALRKAGHEVYTPTLTGLGERKHLCNREIDLDRHIQDILGVIDYEDLSGLVLVGHSYGGMVVTGVADAVPERVGSLVYLDAFVPENAQCLLSIVPAGMPHPHRPLVRIGFLRQYPWMPSGSRARRYVSLRREKACRSRSPASRNRLSSPAA